MYTGTNIGGGAYGANDVNVTAKLDQNKPRVYFTISLVDPIRSDCSKYC